MANTYLTKTPSSTGNRKTFTISWWVKKSDISSNIVQVRSGIPPGGSGNFFTIDGNPHLRINGADNSVDKFQLIPSQKFRDTNAWYHFVVAFDTTQSTASDRIKFYVNGSQVTDFSTSSYPAQNYETHWSSSSETHSIGANAQGGDAFSGCMSHFHYCDGTAYDASAFGEEDSTTGEWKIKTDVSVTYGTNGFFILKDGNSVTDQSGNSNNWTVAGGTLTKTEDCPSNVFATFNPLAKHGKTTSTPSDFMANGNTTFYTPSDNNARQGLFLTSLGATSGKYYCEYKQGGGNRLLTGICNANIFKATNEPYANSNQSALLYLEVNTEIKYDGANYTTGIQGGADGDIFGFALDLDNKHWYIHKNGTYFNSGDPTSGATGTGSIIAATSTSAYFNHGEMFFCAADFSSGDYATSEWNFGNGYFGTTAVSSAGTNASGNGIFEYDVPTGFTALSTKGLNS
jgi:hypothetical protein